MPRPAVTLRGPAARGARGDGAGRPVVATRVGGLAELVDSGTNGCLVDPESADDLADALCVVLESRDLAAMLGRAVRAVAEVRDPAAEYEAGIARLAQWIGAP